MTNTPGLKFEFCPDLARSIDFLQTRTLREKCFQIKCDIFFEYHSLLILVHINTLRLLKHAENIFGTDSY